MLMFADRQVEEREIALTEEACTPGSNLPYRIARFALDGMDQQKFVCPRNLASSKAFEMLWRPRLHMVGCYMAGLLECYFIMDSDMQKDPNSNMTVMSRTITLAQEELQKRDLKLPEHWSFKVVFPPTVGAPFPLRLPPPLTGSGVNSETTLGCAEKGSLGEPLVV